MRKYLRQVAKARLRAIGVDRVNRRLKVVDNETGLPIQAAGGAEMIGNPIGAICKIKELNGREFEGRITSATMRQTTGCVPELDLSVAIDTVSAVECVPPWERKVYVEPPYIPTAFVPSFFRQGTNLKAKQVIFNPPATVVLWVDGTKTVVKCDPEDTYDKRTGLALCYMKKALGNKSRELNKAIRESGCEA